MPICEFEVTVAFYDHWTTSQPDEYQRIVAQSGGVTWLRVNGPEGTARSILVSAPAGGDTVFISLTDGTTG